MLKHCASLALLTVSLLADVPALEASLPANPPKVRSIWLAGSTSFDEETLLKQLRWTRIGGVYKPGQLEADVEVNLKAFLKEHGFMSCEVRWKADTGPNGNVDVRIDISEGPQYRIGKLECKGVAAFAQEQINALFDLREGDIVNFGRIKSALDQLKHMYADRGYINWSYIPEQRADPARRIMDLLFTIVEGKQFRIGFIGIVGCGDQEEENQLRRVITLRPGEIFRDSDLEASVTALNGLGRFKMMGEADFMVYPDDKQGLVGVVFMLKSKG